MSSPSAEHVCQNDSSKVEPTPVKHEHRGWVYKKLQESYKTDPRKSSVCGEGKRKKMNCFRMCEQKQTKKSIKNQINKLKSKPTMTKKVKQTKRPNKQKAKQTKSQTNKKSN